MRKFRVLQLHPENRERGNVGVDRPTGAEFAKALGMRPNNEPTLVFDRRTDMWFMMFDTTVVKDDVAYDDALHVFALEELF